MKNNIQFITYVNIPQNRGKAEKCLVCNKKFGVATREHQCKRCMRPVCEACSPYKETQLKKDGSMSSKPHRLCKFCKEESDSIKQFVEQYKIKTGVDTFAKDWLKDYGQLESAEKDYSLAKENMNVKLERTEISGLENINYSLREFFFYAKREPQRLKAVLLAFIGKYPDVPFTPELVILANFLLCFSTEASAFALLGIIYKHVVPTYFFTSTEYKQEQQMLMTVMKGLGVKENDEQSVKEFIARAVRRYVGTFCLNMFLFESAFFILSQLIIKFESYIKSIGAAFMMSINHIKQGNYEETELYLLRSVRSKELIKLYNQTKIIQFTQAEVLTTINQDQNIIQQLRMDISALKLQISLQQNEIEGYKFQLQQQESPDQQKKDKYIERKNEEIATLMAKVEELQLQNKLLQKNEESLKSENKNLKESLMVTDSQNMILEQKDKIERLQKQLEMQSLIQVERDSARLMKSSTKSTDAEEAKITEQRRVFLEDKTQMENQICNLEDQLRQLRTENESLKEINRTAAQYLDSVTCNNDLIIEFASKPYSFTSKGDTEDIKNAIETRTQQNQLLKQMLKDRQKAFVELLEKVSSVKLMLK